MILGIDKRDFITCCHCKYVDKLKTFQLRHSWKNSSHSSGLEADVLGTCPFSGGNCVVVFVIATVDMVVCACFLFYSVLGLLYISMWLVWPTSSTLIKRYSILKTTSWSSILSGRL